MGMFDSDDYYSEEERRKMNKEPKIPVVGFLARYNGSIGEGYSQYPLRDKDTVFVFGEIENMPGHCVVADNMGKIYWGFHTSDFIKLTEDES